MGDLVHKTIAECCAEYSTIINFRYYILNVWSNM